ncbi:putative abc-type fe3+ transport system protein [Neofusicoccum parvum UCRNP2]|uniref:Putative abc-type fe3+ transport system protein n=1 Tax=Botryosphaeria parva (strain UCR-NP2) TaxID=1287680 RepID=R1FV21_BOTPV|nr:putative abc-type fe3+ transport system protein [Neofusicoccum parvum UCRNP2]
MVSSKLICLLAGAAVSSAFDNQLGFNSYVEVENRTLDEIYQAALKEGGTLTVWHGGDEKAQQDSLKQAFEDRFPGMTLNITVDLSKYHDVNLDRQLATDTLYVDSIILQTLHDYPRWKSQGVLLPYKPLGWDEIYDDFRDTDGYYNGMYVFGWSNVWNTQYVNGTGPTEFSDYLKPEFKNKLVLTYPNDDDAVLYAFDLILKQNGLAWFDALLAQNPRWVRGTATPATLIGSSNGTYTASFTTSLGLSPPTPFNISFPATSGQFVTWPQTGAILRDAPHPESAKLLHSFILSEAYQNATGSWSVRRDVAAPAGYPVALEMPGTDPTKFAEWMADRAAVERLRFFFEDRIGTAQGESPLVDDL